MEVRHENCGVIRAFCTAFVLKLPARVSPTVFGIVSIRDFGLTLACFPSLPLQSHLSKPHWHFPSFIIYVTAFGLDSLESREVNGWCQWVWRGHHIG